MEELNYNNPNLIIESANLKPGKVIWRSPSNIAIVKYWGKHGVQLPRNPSVSFTLASSITDTLIEYQPKETPSNDVELELYFHSERKEDFEAKVKKYFTSLTDIFPFIKQMSFIIRTGNSFPHSAGIASSASAMSALALGLCSIEDELFGGFENDAAFDKKASYISRLGSGSACRSIFPTISVWGKTSHVEGSSDLYGVGIGDIVHENFKNFHDDILIVSGEEKSVSSTAGHALMEGNPFAEPRYNQARKNMGTVIEAIKAGDLETFGKITEEEALTLHAMMMNSNYLLMRPNSLQIMELVRQYRRETNHPVYFTLDAGPNIHLLYPENIMPEVRVFVDEQLAPLCADNYFIGDWVGEGPEQQ